VWPLAAQQEKKKRVSIHGSAALTLGTFTSRNFPGRQPSFFWSIYGNPVLTAYGIPMPVSAMVSNQTSALNLPFSQFGISPTFKWIKLHAGVRSLSCSPFSIGGHTFLGGAVEMNPGRFRFAALGGRFQKAREADTSGIYSLRPAYKRTGYGFKMGLGKTRNYVDLLYFRAKDDTSSISRTARQYPNLTPDENLVLGLSSRLAFGKHLSLQMEGGASLYTRDIRTELLDDDDENGLTKIRQKISPLFKARLGTSLHFAGEAALRYQSRPFQLGLIYRRVEPEYQTMGAWFFQTDVQQITVNPGVVLQKGKTRIQGRVGWQTDDLLRQKPARSQRVIGGLSISLNPSERFGIDLQLNNFQFTQENRYLNSDSLRLQQAVRFASISPHWMRRAGDQTRTWNANLNYQLSNDYNPYTRQELRSDFVFGQVQWNLQEQAKGYSLGFGTNARFNKSGVAAEDQSFGLTATAGKQLARKKIQLQANIQYSLNLRAGKSNGFSGGGGAGISYKALKSTRLYFNAYYLSNRNSDRSYSFVNSSGGVEYTF
jgi:hypothetical protein